MRLHLLPWLLAFSLLLNGITGATASVSMHAAQSTVVLSKNTPGNSDHFEYATSYHAEELKGDHAQDKGDCDNDCCRDSGACQCLCMHHAHAAIPNALSYARTISPAHIATRIDLGHAAPQPSEQIRPPIS